MTRKIRKLKQKITCGKLPKDNVDDWRMKSRSITK